MAVAGLTPVRPARRSELTLSHESEQPPSRPMRGGALARLGGHGWLGFLIVAALAAGVVAIKIVTESDSTADLAATLQSWGSVLSAVSLPCLFTLALVALVHHLAAAGAARAAAGVPMPIVELVGVQFAASAANRVAPVGLGAGTVNARYFSRRGGLSAGEAMAAVSVLVLLGAVADLGAFALLVGLGSAFGLAGAATELPSLLQSASRLVPTSSGWMWLLVPAAATALWATIALLHRGPRNRLARRCSTWMQQYGSALAQLVRCPKRLAALLAASGATTLVLATGFAATAILSPTGLTHTAFVPLMIGYMAASAVGNAVPVPGGVGPTEAAYVGVLVTAGCPSPTALGVVLFFRLVTFWAPAAAGVRVLACLRRSGAI